nr:hypothetical protein Iba_chr05cCG12330 [Ipomoea batatas]
MPWATGSILFTYRAAACGLRTGYKAPAMRHQTGSHWFTKLERHWGRCARRLLTYSVALPEPDKCVSPLHVGEVSGLLIEAPLARAKFGRAPQGPLCDPCYGQWYITPQSKVSALDILRNRNRGPSQVNLGSMKGSVSVRSVRVTM